MAKTIHIQFSTINFEVLINARWKAALLGFPVGVNWIDNLIFYDILGAYEIPEKYSCLTGTDILTRHCMTLKPCTHVVLFCCVKIYKSLMNQ